MSEEICHCFNVTKKDIEDAVDDGALTVEAVGEKTNAGTGCGGCQENIQGIIDEKAKKCGCCCHNKKQ